MGSKALEEQFILVRSVVGEDFSEMDIIRALHMANSDPSAAINIIFDSPHLRPVDESGSLLKNYSKSPSVSNKKGITRNKDPVQMQTSCSISLANTTPSNSSVAASESPCSTSISGNGDWWLLGSSELAGLSTSKGRKLRFGDPVSFSFTSSKDSKLSTKFSSRGRAVVSCSEIVRFSSGEQGEIGRIPNEWARCLSPLVKEKKIKIEGFCKSALDVFGIMDTILLSVSVYINSSMFRKCRQTSFKATNSGADESTVHPLPALFKLLGLSPFKKAELTPDSLYCKKRTIKSKDSPTELLSTVPAEKFRKLLSHGSRAENSQEVIEDSDMDVIVGITDNSELEEIEPPETLLCELRPYQRQALHWMLQLEKGKCLEEAAKTLHPCWDAYHLPDERDLVIYLNAFSGDATTEFPSTQQIARGGILADAMGLGKTIMTISLLLAHSDKGRLPTCSSFLGSDEYNSTSYNTDKLPSALKTASFSGFNKMVRSKATLIGGGNLIVCPMTLLGQWKVLHCVYLSHFKLFEFKVVKVPRRPRC